MARGTTVPVSDACISSRPRKQGNSTKGCKAHVQHAHVFPRPKSLAGHTWRQVRLIAQAAALQHLGLEVNSAVAEHLRRGVCGKQGHGSEARQAFG